MLSADEASPRRFGYAGDFTVGSQLTETNAANAEETNIPVTAMTETAAVVCTDGMCGFLPRGFRLAHRIEFSLPADDESFASHEVRSVGVGRRKIKRVLQLLYG